jgi:hypothetical protein
MMRAARGCLAKVRMTTSLGAEPMALNRPQISEPNLLLQSTGGSPEAHDPFDVDADMLVRGQNAAIGSRHVGTCFTSRKVSLVHMIYWEIGLCCTKRLPSPIF